MRAYGVHGPVRRKCRNEEIKGSISLPCQTRMCHLQVHVRPQLRVCLALSSHPSNETQNYLLTKYVRTAVGWNHGMNRGILRKLSRKAYPGIRAWRWHRAFVIWNDASCYLVRRSNLLDLLAEFIARYDAELLLDDLSQVKCCNVNFDSELHTRRPKVRSSDYTQRSGWAKLMNKKTKTNLQLSHSHSRVVAP